MEIENKRILVYHIQGTVDFNPTIKQESQLMKKNINENVDLVKSNDISFENLNLCFKIIDKSDIVVVTDNNLFISEHIILQLNYAIDNNKPVYAIKYNHKLKFKRVEKAILIPNKKFGGLILKKNGAKTNLF